MPLPYDPKDASNCLPKGDYEASLEKCDETTSEAGNDMWKLEWKIYAPTGGPRKVWDYIVIPTGLFKLKQIAQAIDAGKEFEAGNFDPCARLECCVCISLDIEKQDGFADKNRVKAYKKLDRAKLNGQPPPTMTGSLRQQAAAKAAATDEDFKPLASHPNDHSIPF